ncbi:hypothetical protein M3904_003189 [Vibrio parahaemolyticus]|nr:hypothetical protein [Vibrio parahaemolyticus]
METLSIAQFEELLESEAWTHSQHNHVESTLEENKHLGFAQVESNLDELIINCTETVSFDSQSKELICKLDRVDLVGFEVVDEDGEQLNDVELYDLMYQEFCVDQDILLNKINEEIAA